VQRVLNKAQASTLRKMRNAPYLGPWAKWREFVRDARLRRAVSESEVHKEEIEELEVDRKRLWGMVRTMGTRVVKKTFKECEARYFEKWRACAKMGRMLQYDRALRSILNVTRSKAFRHWRDLVSGKVERGREEAHKHENAEKTEELEELIASLRSDRDYWENIANTTLVKLRGTAVGLVLSHTHHTHVDPSVWPRRYNVELKARRRPVWLITQPLNPKPCGDSTNE
jgi:hypothetical protein